MPNVPDQALQQWVVYEHPLDYPDSYVVRRYLIGRGMVLPDTQPWCIARTLDEARGRIPTGLHRLARHPEDEPQILEVWL